MPQSAALETELSDLTAQRAELDHEVEAAQDELTTARKALRVRDKASVEAATTATARFSVLSEARGALDEQIADATGRHSTAKAQEEREAATERLQEQLAEARQHDAALRVRALEIGREFQGRLEELLREMRTSYDRATAINFACAGLGLNRAPLGAVHAFGEGQIGAALTENGVEMPVVQAVIVALQQLRFAQHVNEHGFPLWQETTANPRQQHEHLSFPTDAAHDKKRGELRYEIFQTRQENGGPTGRGGRGGKK